MTTYRKDEIVVRRIEYGVENGSDIGAVERVKAIAYADYCQRAGYDQRAVMPDDWCRVYARDDEIVFAFEVERQAEPLVERRKLGEYA